MLSCTQFSSSLDPDPALAWMLDSWKQVASILDSGLSCFRECKIEQKRAKIQFSNTNQL